MTTVGIVSTAAAKQHPHLAEGHMAWDAVILLDDRPARSHMQGLSSLVKEHRPDGLGPSLKELRARNDLPELGDPATIDVAGADDLRLVVCGDDGFLSLVVSRLLIIDELWCPIGFVPIDSTSAAAQLQLPATFDDALELALQGAVHPTPMIRDDSGRALIGKATISAPNGEEFTGEIIIDDTVLINHVAGRRTPVTGLFGVRLVPMTTTPGIAAVVCNTPLTKPVPANGVLASLFSRPRPFGTVDPSTIATGRACQAGGPSLAITVDGIQRQHYAKAVTFYRHLRDLQIVRP